MTNKITTGSIANTDAAKSAVIFTSLVELLARFTSMMGIVILSGVFRTSLDQGNSSQIKENARMVNVDMAGFNSGTPTRMKLLKLPQPSMRAASRISLGM